MNTQNFSSHPTLLTWSDSCGWINCSFVKKIDTNLFSLAVTGCSIWMIIYLYNQRVFGGIAGNTVSNNADGCTMECNEISPKSHNDTTNPTKSTKVHLGTPSTSHANTKSKPTTPSMPIDNRRANWWTGLRTMLERVSRGLSRERRNFTRPTCMQRKRERSEIKHKFLLTL